MEDASPSGRSPSAAISPPPPFASTSGSDSFTPSGTPAGQRRFRRDVLRRIAFVRIAQRIGMTLEDIVTALEGLLRGLARERSDWRRLTAGWEDQLNERIAVLEALRSGLSSCIGCGCLSLRTCQLANPDDVAAGLGPGPQYLMTT